jgi:glucose-6-phosphate dehydrogenase assembly protein OpcA
MAAPVTTTDAVWRAQDTTPGDVEAALRRLLSEVHARDDANVPSRVLNFVCIVDRAYAGEAANRLRRVGRFHPSRTIMLAVSPGRTTLDAVATVTTPESAGGAPAIAHETVVLECGPEHVAHADTVVDPLVVSDLPTAVWSPHGHDEGVEALRSLAQIVLLDSADEAEPADALERVRDLSSEVYVVDLAWLRSAPWRERIAAAFDARRRPELARLSEVTVRHHVDSRISALLLAGWLGSRLGWDAGRLTTAQDAATGRAHARKQDVAVRLEADPALSVRGLSSVALASASGLRLVLERGPGGLHATEERPRAAAASWTILGASRGEAGILGEGIRQALLRDPTYRPALEAAGRLAGVR